MQPFEYASPTSLKEAVGMLGSKWGETDILAGGTDQISLMKEYLHTPARLVNIKGVKELHGIKHTAQGLTIGAAVTLDELASDKAVRSEYPALVEAALGVASPQIRNMGTVGGDLCQRPRCWYFRMGYGVLGLKEGKSLIPNGQNEYHSIFGDGPAYFVSPSSFGPALAALGAQVKLVSATGSRMVPVEKFFVTPQSNDTREIALMPNEILAEIVVPSAKGVRNATYEVRYKDALDWPLATASVSLRMSGNKVEKASIVLGHVAPTPVVSAAAAQILDGQTVSADLIERAASAAVASAKPLSQNAYKVQLAKTAVKRALAEATGKA